MNPPPLPSPPLLPLPRQILRARPKASKNQPTKFFGEITITETTPEKEKTLEDIDIAMYELPELPKIEIGDPLLNFLLIYLHTLKVF